MEQECKLSCDERSTLANLVQMKDRLEIELLSLKRAIDEQFVDREEIDKLKAEYESKYDDLKVKYEHQVAEKFAEVNGYLEKLVGLNFFASFELMREIAQFFICERAPF